MYFVTIFALFCSLSISSSLAISCIQCGQHGEPPCTDKSAPTECSLGTILLDGKQVQKNACFTSSPLHPHGGSTSTAKGVYRGCLTAMESDDMGCLISYGYIGCQSTLLNDDIWQRFYCTCNTDGCNHQTPELNNSTVEMSKCENLRLANATECYQCENCDGTETALPCTNPHPPSYANKHDKIYQRCATFSSSEGVLRKYCKLTSLPKLGSESFFAKSKSIEIKYCSENACNSGSKPKNPTQVLLFKNPNGHEQVSHTNAASKGESSITNSAGEKASGNSGAGGSGVKSPPNANSARGRASGNSAGSSSGNASPRKSNRDGAANVVNYKGEAGSGTEEENEIRPLASTLPGTKGISAGGDKKSGRVIYDINASFDDKTPIKSPSESKDKHGTVANDGGSSSVGNGAASKVPHGSGQEATNQNSKTQQKNTLKAEIKGKHRNSSSTNHTRGSNHTTKKPHPTNPDDEEDVINVKFLVSITIVLGLFTVFALSFGYGVSVGPT